MLFCKARRVKVAVDHGVSAGDKTGWDAKRWNLCENESRGRCCGV